MGPLDLINLPVRRQGLALLDPTEQVLLEDGDRTQSPKLYVLSKRQEGG
jgi:hypothetical protein